MEQNKPEIVRAIKFGKIMFIVSCILSFAFFIISLLIFYFRDEGLIMLAISIIWIVFNLICGTIIRNNYFWFGAIYLFFIGTIMIIMGIYTVLSKISNNFLIGISPILLAVIVILIAFFEYKQLKKFCHEHEEG